MIGELKKILLQQYSVSYPTDEEGAKVKAYSKWRGVLKADFELFTDEILDKHNASHQREWCDTLGNEAYRKLVIAAPRNHSKTTVFSINYPLWEIAKNPNVRILLVSAADTQSQSYLRQIKGVIERDQTYVDFAGQLRPPIPEKWTDKEIILARSRTDLKDPTISTVSVEGTILSKRADIIVCDDILNFENTRTPEQRQKIKDWFDLVLLPVLEPGGRLVVVGTIWQVGDLMEELLADPMFDYRKRYKAIIKEPVREDLWQEWCNLYVEEREDNRERALAFRNERRVEMDEGVEVLWSDRMPYEELYKIRFTDPYAFARAYQNDPASRPSQAIKREWIMNALQAGVKYKLQDLPHTEYVALTTAGVDLAISQETLGDDTCEVFLDKLMYDWNGHRKGQYIIRQIRRGKMTGGEIKAMIVTDFYAMRPQGVRVESNAFQEYLVREVNDGGIPIKGKRTGSEKWDSAVGVATIGTLLEHGNLIIPSDPHDARTKDLTGKLTAEMLAFPEGHTGDSLMALWFAYLEMVELTANQYTVPGTPTPIELPKTPETMVIQNRQADKEITALSEHNRRYWNSVSIEQLSASQQKARDDANAEAKRVMLGH